LSRKATTSAPLVRFDCAAIEQVADAGLFGHARGALFQGIDLCPPVHDPVGFPAGPAVLCQQTRSCRAETALARGLHDHRAMVRSFDEAQVLLEQFLLRRAEQGNQRALAALGSIHLERLYAIARNLSGTDAEALDLTEAALRIAWKAIGDLPQGISFRTFLCRCLVRQALSRLREMDATGGRAAGYPEQDGNTAWSSARFAALTRRPDLAERLREALARLDPEDRAVFVLRVVHELPPRECADILEMPDADLRQRAHRASLLMTAFVRHLVAQTAAVRPAPRMASIQ
jgi:RNA polymerase sigma-70 factor, ECF subfamily